MPAAFDLPQDRLLRYDGSNLRSEDFDARRGLAAGRLDGHDLPAVYTVRRSRKQVLVLPDYAHEVPDTLADRIFQSLNRLTSDLNRPPGS